MATKKKKKRRVFPEVEALQEGRRGAAAGLAERQIAVLGREAREQLRSLASGERISDIIPPPNPKGVFSVGLDVDLSRHIAERVQESFLRQVRDSFNAISVGFPMAYPQRYMNEPEPVISPSKLRALKETPARKVTPVAPDMVEVITGWRAWSIAGGTRLKALIGSEIWPAKEMMRAVCTKNGTHLAPDWHCTCGLWAFKDVDKLVAGLNTNSRSTVKVIGSVSLWGKVIETEYGYRAQFGYPSELWLLDDSLEYLGLVYDVPIRKSQPEPTKEQPTAPHYTLWLDEAADMER